MSWHQYKCNRNLALEIFVEAQRDREIETQSLLHWILTVSHSHNVKYQQLGYSSSQPVISNMTSYEVNGVPKCYLASVSVSQCPCQIRVWERNMTNENRGKSLVIVGLAELGYFWFVLTNVLTTGQRPREVMEVVMLCHPALSYLLQTPQSAWLLCDYRVADNWLAGHCSHCSVTTSFIVSGRNTK